MSAASHSWVQIPVSGTAMFFVCKYILLVSFVTPRRSTADRCSNIPVDMEGIVPNKTGLTKVIE